MEFHYRRIINAVNNTLWAIFPEKLEAIVDFLRFKAEGGHLSEEERAAIRAAAARTVAPRSAGAIAVLPVMGTISHRSNLLSDFSGGTSTEAFTRQFRQALADPN